jgi:hypothetical protein
MSDTLHDIIAQMTRMSLAQAAASFYPVACSRKALNAQTSRSCKV